MKVYLLRHGETDFNAQGRYLGRTDRPLTPRGQAALCPAGFLPETVYISPLRRTAQSAEILFPGVAFSVVSDFREMDFGIFEGKSWREMENFAPYRSWVDSGCRGKIPEGESMEEFSRRTCAAFEALADQALERGAPCLVIVAHGGTQMAVMERFALPKKDYFSWRGPLGGGFVLDAASWQDRHVLNLLDTVSYTKGE